MLLDDFTLITETTRPFITLRDKNISFSKQALDEMGNPEHILTYVQETDKLAAFKAGKTGSNLTPVDGKLIRLCDVRISKRLMKLAGVTDCGKGIRFYGEVKDGILLIDMQQQCTN